MKQRQEKTGRIITVFLVAAIGLIWWQVKKIVDVETDLSVVEEVDNYWQGWQEVEGNEFKVQKEVEGYKQTVVAIETEVDREKMDEYIKGLKVGIANFKLIKQSEEGMEGSYVNQGKTIYIIQKILDNWVITGSFVNENSREEVEEVMKKMEEKIKMRNEEKRNRDIGDDIDGNGDVLETN